jgi:filamentous hemagglutinin family protein
MRKSKQTFISDVIRFTCLSGAFFLYSAGVSAADLPTNGSIISGSGSIGVPSDRVMNVSGLDNTIIKWGSFDIGMQNTVNFTGKDGASFNVLNYVSGGAMSSIYGTLNGKGGNVYLVNPAGVFIGSSASIDVGSLYVSNRRIEALENGSSVGNADIASLVSGATPASGAELMSLGYISANKITFDGDRVVLNTERLIDADRETGNEMRKLGAENINVITNDREQVLLGFDAYDEQNGYALSDELASLELANVRVRDAAGNAGVSEVVTGKDGYMWIYTLTQLQAMNTNLSGKYALLGGIDATITEEEGKSFQAIGDEANPFTGVLDGLRNPAEEGADFAIFDLHIQANGRE